MVGTRSNGVATLSEAGMGTRRTHASRLAAEVARDVLDTVHSLERDLERHAVRLRIGIISPTCPPIGPSRWHKG